jgi:hypothetical protein
MSASIVLQYRERNELIDTVRELRKALDAAIKHKDASALRCREAEAVHAEIMYLTDALKAVNVNHVLTEKKSQETIVRLQTCVALLEEQSVLQAAALSHVQEYARTLEIARDAVPVHREDELDAPPSLVTGGPEKSDLIRRQYAAKNVPRTNRTRWMKNAKVQLSKMSAEAVQYVIPALYTELIHNNSLVLKEEMKKQYKHSPSTFASLLPDGALEKQIQQGQLEFAQSLEEHWTVAACVGLKFRCILSRPKWEMWRHTLSYMWDGGVGKYTRVSYNGVKFPRVASRYAVEEEVKAIKKETGLVSMENGLVVTVDLRKLVLVNVLESIKKGLFYIDQETASVKQPHGGNPEVMNVLDSARHHKGMKVTSAGFSFPHGTSKPMAPTNCHEFGHIEGGDGNADMADLGKPLLDGRTRVCFFILYTCVCYFRISLFMVCLYFCSCQ